MVDRVQDRTAQYPGGKGRSFRTLINLMPPHDRFIESHLGGGAVIRNKRGARGNIGIDIDERVIARWRAIGRPDVDVIHGSAISVLPTLDLRSEDFVYADPPYVPLTRRTHRYYRHDLCETEHEQLLLMLKSLPAMVMISGYPHALYDDLLSGWTRVDYPAQTHNGVVTEVAWMNYTPGPVLHDYRYFGENYRDRERFRRRADALLGKLVDADEVELNAALAVLAVKRPAAVRAAATRVGS